MVKATLVRLMAIHQRQCVIQKSKWKKLLLKCSLILKRILSPSLITSTPPVKNLLFYQHGFRIYYLMAPLGSLSGGATNIPPPNLLKYWLPSFILLNPP